MIFYLGYEDDYVRYMYGVGFMFLVEIVKIMMGWELVNVRLIIVRFYGIVINILIV